MIGGVNLVDIWRGALTAAALVGAPFVLAALLVGLVTSLLQAATQLQDNALTFVPKVVATGAVLVVAGPWVLGQLVRYGHLAFTIVEHIGLEGGR